MPKHYRRDQIFDTSDEARRVQREIYRKMSPQRKIELVEDANWTARLLALAGLRSRFPEADEDEITLRLFHLIHGTELATKAWGPLPAKAQDDG